MTEPPIEDPWIEAMDRHFRTLTRTLFCITVTLCVCMWIMTIDLLVAGH